MASVKICGIKTPEMAEFCADVGAKFIGMVMFERSPRHLGAEQAAPIASKIRGRIKSVVVTVNPDNALLYSIRDIVKPDYIQLHGSESVERVKEIKELTQLGVIKAFGVKNEGDFEGVMCYTPHVDYYLFDTKPESDNQPGGLGVSFNWSILQNRQFDKPWFLAGGLSPENLKDAVKKSGAFMLDVSSGVENPPYVKNNELVERFVNRASQA